MITDSDNIQLLKLPDFHEIKDALFSIESNKTPGSDGFGAGFFRQYWSLIGQEFTNCILEVFRNGKILKEINHTFITFIPKMNNLPGLIITGLLVFVLQFIKRYPKFL